MLSRLGLCHSVSHQLSPCCPMAHPAPRARFLHAQVWEEHVWIPVCYTDLYIFLVFFWLLVPPIPAVPDSSVPCPERPTVGSQL